MLLAFFRKLKNNLYDFGGAVVMNLSRAVDTINYNLHISKLNSYGSLKLICSYFTYRWNRTKFNSMFRSRGEVSQEVVQGFAIGSVSQQCICLEERTVKPIIFLMIRIFVHGIKNSDLVLADWKMTVFQWLNGVKLNQEKCYLVASKHKHRNVWARIK